MKYPVSKSDYETFRSVVEVIIEQFKQQPWETNRFYQAAVKAFGEQADEAHVFALFLHEVYSFRYISVITGYARRNGLTWINRFVCGIPDINVVIDKTRQHGRCDPAFTHLLFTNADTASFDAEPVAVIPILECVEEDHQIRIGVVERKEIERALDIFMTRNQTRHVSDNDSGA